MPVVLVALGANLPIDLAAGVSPPAVTLRAAIGALTEAGLTPLTESPFYATPCFPPGAGPDYVNAAVELHSDANPDAILALLHGIEARFSRTRDRRWAGRTLDLDLLAVGDTVLPDAETHRRWRDLSPEVQRTESPDRLILPHPRMQDRAFVLVPLADVAPDWRHPLLGLTVTQMLSSRPRSELTSVRRLA